jgi:hydrogenase nickel incorporation protein HypB
MEVKILQNILAANDVLAEKNKEIFKKKNVFVINLLSAPGSGKTTLLEKTVKNLKNQMRIAVIEGDISTSRDAERLKKYNIPILQINTENIGGDCHLDANMIHSAINNLDLSNVDLLIIENVGNLVCPAEFNVGENCKVVMISVTEGDDKVLKYPLAFNVSKLVLVNKIDLLPYTDFDKEKFIKEVKMVNPEAEIFFLSAKTEEGIENWLKWIREKIESNF